MSDSNIHALPEGYKLNHYVIDSVIGQGGFGIVYRAHHEHFNEQVVIKEHLPGYCAARTGDSVVAQSTSSKSAFDESFKRFFTEGQTLNKLKHDNIVRCTDLFTANGTAYLVMNYEDGMSLFDLLVSLEQQGGHYSEEQLLSVFVPLAGGIAFCHEQGVLHRDIKPGNVFIRREDGSPVLLDFGAAKRNFSNDPQSEAPVTDFYAPPEQNDPTQTATPAIDTHAFGGLMYRVVTGADGPAANTRMMALARNQTDPLVPAAELAKGKYSKELLELIDHCLSFHVENRPAEMRAVENQLKKLAARFGSKEPNNSTLKDAKLKLNDLIALAGSDGIISEDEMSHLLTKAEEFGISQLEAIQQVTNLAHTNGWVIERPKQVNKQHKQKDKNNEHKVNAVPNDPVKPEPETEHKPKSESVAKDFYSDEVVKAHYLKLNKRGKRLMIFAMFLLALTAALFGVAFFNRGFEVLAFIAGVYVTPCSLVVLFAGFQLSKKTP